MYAGLSPDPPGTIRMSEEDLATACAAVYAAIRDGRILPGPLLALPLRSSCGYGARRLTGAIKSPPASTQGVRYTEAG